MMLKTDGGPLTEVERPTKEGDPRTVPIGVSRTPQGIKWRYGGIPVDENYLGYYSYEWDGNVAHWHPFEK